MEGRPDGETRGPQPGTTSRYGAVGGGPRGPCQHHERLGPQVQMFVHCGSYVVTALYPRVPRRTLGRTRWEWVPTEVE